MSNRDEHGLIKDESLFSINALWGLRAENSAAIVKRWMALIERLQLVDDIFERWEYYDDARGFVAYVPDFDIQFARARSEMETNPKGDIVDTAGTNLWLSNNFHDRPLELNLKMRAGVDYPRGSNFISLGTSMFEEADPRLLQYRIFRGVLLAAVETFDATHGVVWPHAIKDFWTEPSGISDTLDLGWMSYVSPRFAHLVTPPPTAISEHRPDGGLFMAATTEVFAMDNPAHLAAAQRIRDSLEAYNAVLWTKETGK